MRANERTDERVAQYSMSLFLNHWAHRVASVAGFTWRAHGRSSGGREGLGWTGMTNAGQAFETGVAELTGNGARGGGVSACFLEGFVWERG